MIPTPVVIVPPGSGNGSAIPVTVSGNSAVGTYPQSIPAAQQAQARANLGASAFLPGFADTIKTTKSSAVLQIVGDSTSQQAGWPTYFASLFAAKYPNYTTKLRFWDGSKMPTKPFSEVVSNLGVREWRFISRGCFLPLSEFACPTGDIDIRYRANSSNTNPGASETLVACQNSGSIGLRLVISSAGGAALFWSPDGTTNKSAYSTVTVASAVGASGDYWLRAVLDVDNGSSGYSVYFYTSTDGGATWTQLGTTVTAAGVTTIAAVASSQWTLGESSGSFATHHACRGLEIRSGINGKIINPLTLDSWMIIAADAAVLAGGPTLEIVGVTQAGQHFNYWNSSSRYETGAAYGSATYVIFNDGHNYTSGWGAGAISDWNSILTKVLALDASSCVGICTENPRTSTQYGLNSGVKAAKQKAWAGSRGIGVCDAYTAFMNDVRGLATLISGDSLHPSSDGYTLWANKVMLDACL